MKLSFCYNRFSQIFCCYVIYSLGLCYINTQTEHVDILQVQTLILQSYKNGSCYYYPFSD